MRRNTLTQGQIIELTREVVHGFYGHSLDHLTHYLSENFVWIGAFDFQFTVGKQQFLDTIKSELNSTPFNMNNEHYELIGRDRDTFILCAKFDLTSDLPTGKLLQMRTRLTLIWKYIDGELKLFHVHGSNAHDVPLTVETEASLSDIEPDDFIKYIIDSTPKINAINAKKTMFRLITGEHCVIPEDEILYLQADGQTTKIYTKNDEMQISGVLRTHQEMLSNSFFRVHKSYLINTAFITAFKRYEVTLRNEIHLPIGKEKYLSLKQFCAEAIKSEG